jgi:hypothetical protein
MDLLPSECNDLKKYIQTKTGRDSDTYKLFDYLITKHSKLEDILSIDEVAHKLFPKAKVKAISNYMSTLVGWTEEWIVLKQLEKEKHAADLLLVKWYNKKGNYYHANQIAKKIEHDLDTTTKLDFETSKTMHELLHAQYLSNNPIKYSEGWKMLENLVVSYGETVKSQYMVYLAELYSWGEIQRHDFTDSRERIKRAIKDLPENDDSNLMALCLEMVENTSLKNLNNLVKILFNKGIETNSELNSILIFYCIKIARSLWQKGKLKDKSLMIELYKFAMSSGYYTENGKLNSLTYHNLIQVLCQIYDHNEVNKFIIEWNPIVAIENHESTMALAKAQNCFFHEQYSEIIPLTYRSDFSSFHQKNTAQTLHTIARFMERDEDYNAFETALQNSIYFTKRNRHKMSEPVYEGSLNLYDFMKKASKNDEPIDLSFYPILYYRSWCNLYLEQFMHNKKKYSK